VHDAYGTRPLDLAAAAVFRALGQDGALPTMVLADCGAGPAPAGAGQHGVPAHVSIPVAAQAPGELLQATKAAISAARDTAAGRPGAPADADAGGAGVSADAGGAPADAGGAGVSADSGRAGASADICAQPPCTTLRLLPLPLGAELADPGTGPLLDRTVVVLAGAELLVVPAAAGEAAGPATTAAGEPAGPAAGVGEGESAGPAAAVRVFAEHIRAALELLVSHCAASTPVYSPGDFPDAGLDDATLARLLDRIGGGQ
jgi:hypothetical protein